jgi:YaiO family outer membrane protein
MKPIIRSLAQLALLATAGTAAAQTDPAASQTAAPGVSASPESFDVQFQNARRLALSGQRDEAIRAYSDLLVRSPGNADVLLGRGQVYSWMGRWPEAESDLLAATAKSPRYAGAWTALGNMYLWSDRPAQAVTAYAHTIELNPTDAAGYIARGRAYRAAGDVAAARADFDAAASFGADAGQIANYQQSLTPRVQNPEAVVPVGYRWSATLSGSWTTWSPERADWTDYTLSVRRHFDRGSLAVEFLGANRFDITDQAWALDAYLHLWARAYVNLRYQQGPQADLFPSHAWRAELFQGVGRGWELSASYDRLEFSSSGVDMYGLGVGKYVGNWYLRWRRLYVPGDESDSVSDQLLVRNYYRGDGDNYVEARLGFGRSDDSLSSSSSSRNSASIAWVHYPTPRWGFKIGADMSNESGGFDGRGVFGALYLRW